MQKISEELQALFLPVIQEFGADFVDLEIGGSAKKLVIKIFVDEAGGIKIEKCARISRALQDALQMSESTFSGDFRLEVSSPGVDRPLKSARDFLRNIGRSVEVIYAPNDEKIVGEVVAVTDEQLELVRENGKSVILPMSKIKRAMLQLKWS